MIGERDWLLISEIFVTLQGEGPSTGQRAMFIRLGGCNQHCRWCDTPYTWVFDERHVKMHQSGKQFSPSQELRRVQLINLASQILDADCPLIVITGGEPMLQAETLAALISAVNENLRRCRFEIETAGTVSPAPLAMFENVRFNVSPKLASSGNELELRRKVPVLKELDRHPGTAFKFVIVQETIEEDLAEIVELQKLVGMEDDTIWLMPQGKDKYEILRAMPSLSELALERSWSLSTRLHVLLWGDERGR